MIDKSIFIMICMYIFSFALLGGQFMADSYGVTIRAPDGTAIKSTLVDISNVTNINIITSNVTNSNETNFILDPVFAGATVAWQLFQLLTGSLIFNILSLFGLPSIFITGISIAYSFLVIVTLIAKIRGV